MPAWSGQIPLIKQWQGLKHKHSLEVQASAYLPFQFHAFPSTCPLVFPGGAGVFGADLGPKQLATIEHSVVRLWVQLRLVHEPHSKGSRMFSASGERTMKAIGDRPSLLPRNFGSERSLCRGKPRLRWFIGLPGSKNSVA